MSKPPPAPPSLAELRKEIDAIDEQVHRLLMARGDIIDRLIQVKQTQEVGSAFRPAREADMMRRLVKRHRGILPLDTVESIWRVIISTFTYVQAPFSVHADVSIGESAMRDSARFHFGFTVPYVAHFSAQAAVDGVARSKGDLALVSATSSRAPWWIALEAHGAPKIIARLPFVERADHPAALPVFVISRVAADAMATETAVWSVRVAGREVRVHGKRRLHKRERRDDDAPDALGGVERQDAFVPLDQPSHHLGLARGAEGGARLLALLGGDQPVDDLAALHQELVHGLVDTVDLLAQIGERGGLRLLTHRSILPSGPGPAAGACAHNTGLWAQF